MRFAITNDKDCSRDRVERLEGFASTTAGIHRQGWGAAIALVFAIVLRGLMSSVKFRVGRRLRSSALLADAWNDAVDILSAVAALVAVGLAEYDPARFLALITAAGSWWALSL